jgi:hypothetical protein
MFRKVPRFFSSVYNTASDFCSSFIKSCLVKDDKTPIRSGHSGVEFLPVAITTMAFSLDQIKQIKAKLGVVRSRQLQFLLKKLPCLLSISKPRT